MKPSRLGHLRRLAPGWSTLALAAFLALMIAACGEPGGSNPEAEEMEVVRLAMMRYLSFAPLFVALDEGFFEDEGLIVEPVTIARSDAAIPPLVQGMIDVVPAATMPSYFNMIERGASIKIVAGKGTHRTDHCAYSGIMVRSELLDSGKIHSVADLAGHSAAIEPTSPSYYRYFKFLEAGGLTLDDMRAMGISMAAKIEGFRQGALDTATASEPWISVIEAEGHARLWVRSQDLLPGFQFGLLLFGKTLLEERPDVGEKFMVAYLRAVRQLNREGKTERHIDILARHTRLDREVLRKACWPPISDRGSVDLDSLHAFQDWAIGAGMITQPVPVETMVDHRFTEFANQELDRRERASQ